MITLSRRLLIVVLVLYAANAQGASNEREPHIGYLYPAGGQQGSVIKITVGGQFIKDINEVYVTGQGVHGSVIRYIGRVKPLNGDQRKELQRQINELRKKLQGLGKKPMPPIAQDANKPADANKPDDTNTPPVTLPDHPLLRNLEKLSPKGLQKVAEEFLSNKYPVSMQIGEMAIIEITIDPNAEPGDRELRIGTSAGLTNPLCFQVGLLPETCSPELKDPGKPFTPKVRIPVLLNGQILPGEADRFRFSAKKGQNLTIEAQARHLIPYLADAVPGWFQAILTLYDTKGKELAYAGNYLFNPDPVLFYRITRDGDYEIEIRDSIYRGREDFVYRVSLSEQPFITQMFPLGGQTGVFTVASISGWNLDTNEIPLDTMPGGGAIRQAQLRQNNQRSNSVPYAVDTLPECDEIEDNGTTEDAQHIILPQIVNGRISKPGDIDIFRFDANAGDEIVAEVYARRLNSPLDSLLWLSDANGKVLGYNDDNGDKNVGLLTHNADSYLRLRLPETGAYFMHLADSENHGGPDYGYRLRISHPQPDFALLAAPSSINILAGGTVPVTIEALRKDGFNGEIEVMLKDAPPGFKLSGARIPAGCDRLRVTLTAPQKPLEQPINLQLEGRAKIDGQAVSRPVTPAEDMMQAFIYQHMVPSQELMVMTGYYKRRAPTFELVDDNNIKIPAGGKTKVRVKIPRRPASPAPTIYLELS
ncbi:MAG: PPC domain-containing protein [Sedimentisphaerales bacterium]